MYFPYLRGRQYELLALHELVTHKLLGEYVTPIIEPVKLSPTLVNTMSDFVEANHQVAIVRNPVVGSFMDDWDGVQDESREAGYKQKFTDLYKNPVVIKSVTMQENVRALLDLWNKQGISKAELLAIVTDHSDLDLYETLFSVDAPRFALRPDEAAFRRRVRKNKVLLEDRFAKRGRNADYQEQEDEFFSDDHIYFKEENFVGFSDYSVVGNEYLEAGFAPYAVAIHIVYFGTDGSLRVRHFVSDSNEDSNNPALKFYQAVSKLAKWYNSEPHPIELTAGLKSFLQHYEQQSYPGLGTVKKLSIMHHLELMGKYLSEVV